MPGVILIDDEPAARRGMARLLLAHPDVQVLGEAESVPAANELLQHVTPDAVFLDIEMPLGSGFDLIQSLSPTTWVIFVTAHAEHAPLAFEVAALDYLLKPVRPARLAQALDRLRRVCQVPDGAEPLPPAPHLGTRDHLCLNTGGRTLIVPVGEIVALRAEGDFTWFMVADQAPVLMSYSLGRYEAMLPQPPFARVSRSLVVNLTRVESLNSNSRDETLLKLRGLEEPMELRRVAAARLRALI